MSVRHLLFFGWGAEGLLAGTLSVRTCHGGGLWEAVSQSKSVSRDVINESVGKEIIIR